MKETGFVAHSTGLYAVGHFGSDEKDSVPCYLKKVPYVDAHGNTVTSYKHFTFNLNESEIFSGLADADNARKEIEKNLSDAGHVLAGHVKVLELGTRICAELNEP